MYAKFALWIPEDGALVTKHVAILVVYAMYDFSHVICFCVLVQLRL